MSPVGSAAYLTDHLPGTTLLAEPLSRHTTYRIGGPADIFLTARSTEELIRAVDTADQAGIPWHVIGNASNLLVADKGIDGLVIKVLTRKIAVTRLKDGRSSLRADAGCVLSMVAKKAAESGLGGLEWAATIPGTVGAAIVNNSGAFGSCVADCLEEAELYFPRSGHRTVESRDLGYAYRTSRLKSGGLVAVVLQATFRTQPGEAPTLQARVTELEELRRATQPSGSSVGSIFRNPPGNFAGALIEKAGLKGQARGGAAISVLHANFIVNRKSALASDVFELIHQAQLAVWEQDGIWLVPEIQFLGRWAEEDLALLAEPPRAAPKLQTAPSPR
ncbi:MAG: UDP-N-acetylmuramate dehydrogenase [Chloroflexi bacterium]|nr:UDP-N-acetylmuramate dehydrogenase [Chloroflexota bacterium]